MSDQNINTTSKEEYMYRYIPLKYFLQTLDNRSLYFPRVSKWDDPYELFLFKQKFINSTGTELDVMSQTEHIFGQCWTIQRDTDAFWRIYSPDLMSVRIKTTKKKIESLVEQNQGKGFLIKSALVDYWTQVQVESWIKSLSLSTLNSIPFVDSLFIKRNSFSHEKEFRVIVWETDFNEYGMCKPCRNHIDLSINPTDFILEVSLDPRLSKEEVGLLKHAIALRLGNVCPISQSRLYKIKANTIII